MESFPSSPPHEKTSGIAMQSYFFSFIIIIFSDFKYNPNAPAFTPQGDGKYSKCYAKSYLLF